MAKILIVEDDSMLLEIYERKFTDAGFELKTVANGKAVQIESKKFLPDLILLDIVLPDMDGFEILEVLGKDEMTKNIPIYVFSNLSAKEDIDRATQLGARGFITKSKFTPSQLVEEVRKIMSNPPEPRSEPVLSKNEANTNEEKIPNKKEQNGMKVLIIEDEDVFLDMFGDKFHEDGFEVVKAKNGKWGVKEAEKGGFSCILLDMMMPAMNGYEAIKELRENENTKDTPVIILSNSALDSEVKKALELGANEYYIKTKITPGEVLKRAKELISKN